MNDVRLLRRSISRGLLYACIAAVVSLLLLRGMPSWGTHFEVGKYSYGIESSHGSYVRFGCGFDAKMNLYPRNTPPMVSHGLLGITFVYTEFPAAWSPGPWRREYEIRLPFVMVIILLASWPAIHFSRSSYKTHLSRTIASRVAAGLCPACGYDLRATPGRCPECGRAVEMGSKA